MVWPCCSLQLLQTKLVWHWSAMTEAQVWCTGMGRAEAREQRNGGTVLMGTRTSNIPSTASITAGNLFGFKAMIGKPWSISPMQLPPRHCPQKGEGPSLPKHVLILTSCAFINSTENDKNMPWMNKRPSAGSTFLKRLPTPTGKQPAAPSVCKAAVAGGSCPVQLWGCALQCSHCKMWSRRHSAPSADTVPSCILYAFSCILKAGSDLRCTAQQLCRFCWEGLRSPQKLGDMGSDLIPVQARWSLWSPAGLLQSKGMNEH